MAQPTSAPTGAAPSTIVERSKKLRKKHRGKLIFGAIVLGIILFSWVSRAMMGQDQAKQASNIPLAGWSWVGEYRAHPRPSVYHVPPRSKTKGSSTLPVLIGLAVLVSAISHVMQNRPAPSPTPVVNVDTKVTAKGAAPKAGDGGPDKKEDDKTKK